MNKPEVFRSAILRLNWYKYFKGMSTAEVLGLYPENGKFLEDLKETGNRDAVEVWLELHPEYKNQGGLKQ